MSTAKRYLGVVLSAGFGTRLRPATERCPKPAVPFLGTPLAVHSALALADAGIERVGVNLHHLPEVMSRAYAEHAPEGVAIVESYEETIQGTGGGVRGIRERLDDSGAGLVVCHGDVLFGHGLREVIAAHEASGRALTLVLKVRDGSTPLGGVETDERGEIVRILSGESPRSTGRRVEHAFTGVHVIEPEILDRIRPEGFHCLVSELYPELLREGLPIGAHITTAFHADVGTCTRFLDAQQAVFDAPGRLDHLSWPEPRGPGLFIGPEVTVEPGVELTGPVRVTGPATLRAGAQIGPNVCIAGAITVASDARIQRASIWGAGDVGGAIREQLVPVEAP